MGRIFEYIVLFCIIDVLFLTYLPFIAMSASFLIIIPWFIFHHNKINNDNEFKTWKIFFTLSFISVVISFIVNSGLSDANELVYKNTKTWFIFITSTIYYFFFRKYLPFTRFNVNKLLYYFVLYCAFFALIYYANPSTYMSLKSILNPYDGVTNSFMDDEYGFQYRYNFLWTDANNVAYMFSAVTLYLISTTSMSLKKKIILIFSTLFIMIATMSTGGTLSFLVTLFLSIFIFKDRQKSIKFSMSDTLFITILLIAALVFFMNYFNVITDNLIVKESLDRMEGNSIDSRTVKWKYLLENKPLIEYLFIGRGPIVLVKGISKSPHSGFLYLTYSYGFISLMLFLRLFFVKVKGLPISRFLFMIPIFIGFSINTLVANPKIMGLIAILTVLSRYSRFKKNEI